MLKLCLLFHRLLVWLHSPLLKETLCPVTYVKTVSSTPQVVSLAPQLTAKGDTVSCLALQQDGKHLFYRPGMSLVTVVVIFITGCHKRGVVHICRVHIHIYKDGILSTAWGRLYKQCRHRSQVTLLETGKRIIC
jgi:hypothetical protein